MQPLTNRQATALGNPFVIYNNLIYSGIYVTTFDISIFQFQYLNLNAI